MVNDPDDEDVDAVMDLSFDLDEIAGEYGLDAPHTVAAFIQVISRTLIIDNEGDAEKAKAHFNRLIKVFHECIETSAADIALELADPAGSA